MYLLLFDTAALGTRPDGLPYLKDCHRAPLRNGISAIGNDVMSTSFWAKVRARGVTGIAKSAYKRAMKSATGRKEYPVSRALSIIRSRLSDTPIIVEAGAHDGSDTARLSGFFPRGQIHAFEPVPQLYIALTNQTRQLPNVIPYELALRSTSGSATLHLSEGRSDGSSSLLKPKRHLDVHPDVTFERTLQVNCLSLDDWANSNNIKRVDFAWLDLQGMEYDVLRASSKVFPTIQAIYSEVSLLEMYEGCPLYPEYRSWLESVGFQVVMEDLPWSDMGNVLFIR